MPVSVFVSTLPSRTATSVSLPSVATETESSVPRIAAIVLPVLKRVGRSFQRITCAQMRPKNSLMSRPVAFSSISTRDSGPTRSTLPSERKRTLARPCRVTSTSLSCSGIAGETACVCPSRSTLTWPVAASSVAIG